MHRIQNYTRDDAKRKVGAGWHSLIDLVYDEFEKDGDNIVVTTVKEKFGGLRIYFENGNDFKHLGHFVDNIEQRSFFTCEMCGKRGQLRRGAWLKTLCEAHCNGAPPMFPDRSEQLELFGDWK